MKKNLLYNLFHPSFLQVPILLVICTVIIAIGFYHSQMEKQLQERYNNAANEIRQQTQLLIHEKKEAILSIALSMSRDSGLISALQDNTFSHLQLTTIARQLKTHTHLKNIWFQIINKKGTSVYRSWTKKRGDNISLARFDIAAILQKPEIKTTISTGKFALTFKAIVPIYDNTDFKGVFEVIAQFNSIASKLEERGINAVFLVDKSYRKQLTKAKPKRFIEEYYLANFNAKKYYLQLVSKELSAGFITADNNYFLDNDNSQLRVYFPLPDINNNPMGHFFLFKSLNDIPVQDIYDDRNNFMVAILLLAVLVLVLMRYIHTINLTKKIQDINIKLKQKVSLKNKQLIEQGIFLQSVVDGVSNSIMVIDKDYNIKMMNKIAQTMSGNDFNPETKQKCYKVIHNFDSPCHSIQAQCLYKEVFSTGTEKKVIHEQKTENGKSQFIELTASPLFNAKGEVDAIIELGNDLTEHMLIHQQLEQQKNRLNHQAHHDALTGLPNRVLFIDRVDQAIKLAKRERSIVAVLFLDLDRFKEINDSLGHSIGDQLLIEVAARLKKNIRQVDTVARLGGDEFTLILSGIKHNAMVMEITQKLIETLKEKFVYKEHELYISASIGISLYPDDADNTESLLRNADSAMYQAKNEGRDNYQFYTKEMTELALDRMLLEKNIRRAIENDEFILFYQPQYNIKTNQLIGMEALIRWQHPEQGLVSPDRFIPIAEESGMIIAIGWQVINKVLKQLNHWSSMNYAHGQISINLSVQQIQQDDFVERIIDTIEEYQYDPQHIQFEVTESYIMTDPEQAISTLQKLRDLRFSISIDDFGTGYSSLSYLKRLPVNELKIDQSFIRDVSDSKDDEAIVRSVISLAKSLNLHVIAEGVETQEQYNFLHAEQCETLQGFLFHKPAPAEEVSELLKKNKDKSAA